MLVNKNKLYISPTKETLPIQEIIVVEDQQQDHSLLEDISAVNPIDVDDLYSTYSTATSISSPIPSTSSSTNNQISTIPTSSTTPVLRSHDNSTPSSGSTIRSNQSTSAEFSFYNDINDFIQEITVNLQLDHKVSGMTVVSINNTINVVDEILNWISNVDNKDLLKKPMISVITER